MAGRSARRTNAQRLGGVLEKVTRQSGHLAPTPDYGSWVLGRVSDSPRRRRIRIQVVLTTFVLIANLIGIGVALLVVTVIFPSPSVFDHRVWWITFVVAPAYIATALLVGVIWATNRVMNNVRWSIEQREPTVEDQRNTFFAPWHLTRVLLILWSVGAALLTLLHGLVDAEYVPKVLIGVSFSGIVVSGSSLSVHRVRPPSGGRPGARGRAAAAPACPRNHGTHAAGVGGRFGRPGTRHSARRGADADAAQPHAHAVRRCSGGVGDLRAGIRVHPDMAAVLVHRDPGAGGPGGVAAGGARRSRHRPGGLRWHRIGPAAARLQPDGARLARARTGAGPVRAARGSRGRSAGRTGTARARRRGAACGGRLRRHHRFHEDGQFSAAERDRRDPQPLLRRRGRRGRETPRNGQQVRGRRGAGHLRCPLSLENPDAEALWRPARCPRGFATK